MWILEALMKFGLPIILSYLQKTGAINTVEAVGIKAGTHVLAAVERITVERDYPTDKNVQNNAGG
jgi:hypothetical protein